MPQVRLVGWKPGLEKVALAALLRERGGLGLKAAHESVVRLTEGGQLAVDLPRYADAVSVAIAAARLGAYVYLEHDRPTELRRLRVGPEPGERPWGMEASFAISCRGDAAAVLERAKEVLQAVLEHDPEDWPSDNRWRELLPRWFVGRCAGGASALPEAWTVEAFAHWFRDEMRSWWWFDGVAESQDLVRVTVEVDGFPFGWGELKWLFLAAGAGEVGGPH